MLKKKEYLSWWFNSFGMVTMCDNGYYNEKEQTFTITCHLWGKLVTVLHHFTSPNTAEWSIIVKDSDGKVYHKMIGVSTRQTGSK